MSVLTADHGSGITDTYKETIAPPTRKGFGTVVVCIMAVGGATR